MEIDMFGLMASIESMLLYPLASTPWRVSAPQAIQKIKPAKKLIKRDEMPGMWHEARG